MDFLKAEIERKKRQVSDVLVGPDKKYFKRGDLRAKETKEYMEKYVTPREDEIRELEEMKKKRFEKVDKETFELGELPRVEVVRRLRERFQPIILFSETIEESLKRLRKLEVDEPEDVRGIRNDYQEAMEQVDKAYLNEILRFETNKDEKSKFDQQQLWESKFTYEDILEMGEKLNRGDLDHDNSIPALKTVKLSVKGKMETGTYTQTKSYLKPLLRMLKKQTVTDDIRDSLVNMIKRCLKREYIKCHEVYMEMAIGNAPWPIGVTNAGIHARPARENIFSKHVAHVLNDETQRKFIQGLKRLLTKAQQYYPTDPSRSIDYVKPPLS
ncbi:PRPF18 [Lepeophtheirus salmonis]|uniref:Pre-mRNA-splicing factor 18 n=1 Tax=Lepeophtheirus salmonis TaxID=72036 RepID=A0A7R8CJC0_LEPSM|nr:PRPF18 [Lepeophtheirus salmonis]CAF2809751.1 PRPF18 [Lepeophtheirus salmonis]